MGVTCRRPPGVGSCSHCQLRFGEISKPMCHLVSSVIIAVIEIPDINAVNGDWLNIKLRIQLFFSYFSAIYNDMSIV